MSRANYNVKSGMGGKGSTSARWDKREHVKAACRKLRRAADKAAVRDK